MFERFSYSPFGARNFSPPFLPSFHRRRCRRSNGLVNAAYPTGGTAAERKPSIVLPRDVVLAYYGNNGCMPIFPPSVPFSRGGTDSGLGTRSHVGRHRFLCKRLRQTGVGGSYIRGFGPPLIPSFFHPSFVPRCIRGRHGGPQPLYSTFIFNNEARSE